MNELQKIKLKLKMMEISFEQINNSRNDMIKQLAEQEIINEKNQKLEQLIKKRIELLNQLIIKKKEQNEPYKWVSDMIIMLQKLIEDSKK